MTEKEMTAEGAIKIMTKIRSGGIVSGGEYMRAMRLGIEALEFVEKFRKSPQYWSKFVQPHTKLLPSETGS